LLCSAVLLGILVPFAIGRCISMCMRVHRARSLEASERDVFILRRAHIKESISGTATLLLFVLGSLTLRAVEAMNCVRAGNEYVLKRDMTQVRAVLCSLRLRI
jgi:hypothetical protein